MPQALNDDRDHLNDQPAQVSEEDKNRFLNALDPNGQFRTNREVRETLRLEADRYLEIRETLKDEDKIVIGRGQGGRVALKLTVEDIRRRQAEPSEGEANQDAEEATLEEKGKTTAEWHLYEPFRDSIEHLTKKGELQEESVVEITARQGRRQNGMWSRPDVCRISVLYLPFLGQKVVEVTTYEIKLDTFDIDSVYEALSHSRRSHKSYLAIYIPQSTDEIKKKLERVKIECARTGVGLIVFQDPKDPESFEFLIEPRANWTDLSEVNDFIESSISSRETIRRWVA
jgi:hypothetical protein